MDKVGTEVQGASVGSHSSDEDENEKVCAAPEILDEVIDRELEDFLGDMENELDQLILESKSNPSAPKMPFAVWYENYTKQRKCSYLASDGWELYTSPDGYPYYYNSVTEESEWAPYDEPSGTSLLHSQNISKSPETEPVQRAGKVETDRGWLADLQNLSPSPAKRPVTTITHMTPGGGEADDCIARGSLLLGLREVSPSPERRPVSTVKNITPGMGNGTRPNEVGHGGGPALTGLEEGGEESADGFSPLQSPVAESGVAMKGVSLLTVARNSLFSFGSGWDKSRKSQGRYTLEQIAIDASPSVNADVKRIGASGDGTVSGGSSAAVQAASAYGLSLYSAAVAGWLGKGDTGDGERSGSPVDEATREALRKQLYDKIKSLPGSVEITVAPRTCTKIPFIVPKGKELVWKMQVKDYDLGFAVRLRQQGEGGAVESDLLPLEKIGCDEVVSEGCCAESITRSFIFVFDNSYSKLRSKTCVYNIKVVSEGGDGDGTNGNSLTGISIPIAISGEQFSAKAVSSTHSAESDDGSSCGYASAVDEEEGGCHEVTSRCSLSGEESLTTGRAVVGGNRGFAVDLVPLASSSRAVAAPASPDKIDEYVTSTASSSLSP